MITQKTKSIAFAGANGFTYGNPSQITTTTIDKDPTSPWTGNTFTDVLNITPYEVGGSGLAGWCIHHSSQVSEQRTQPGGASLTHTTSFSVNSLNECELDSQTIEPSSSVDKVVTAYVYSDGCGNVNTIKVTGQNESGTAMTERDTTLAYGTHCLAPESVTNALLQSTQASYRYDLGLQTSATDPNGLTASTTYNDLGQVTLVQRPDGTQTSFSLTACSGLSCLSDSTLRFEVQRSEQDATTGHSTFWYTQEYFDAFGRQRYSMPLQSNGAQVTTAVTFDSRGRAVTHTNPYGNGFSAYTTTTAFDDLNRPTSVYRPISSTNPTLEYTYFTYQGRTGTLKDARLNVTTRQADVIGELLRVTDPDGVSKTNYGYNPFGALTSISDPASNTTTRTYDTLGYLMTNSSDPDRGSWVYQYDSLGELINLRDAKTSAPSWTQQLSYDALGRTTQRIESEGTTTWTWGAMADNDATHKYIGRLKQLSGPGDTESNTFDAIGRPQSHSMIWAGTTYAINFAYNTLGKLDVLTYPAVPGLANRFQVKYGYTDGYLSALQNYTGNVAGTTFWQLTAGVANMDPWGHVVDETLGTTTAVRIRSAFDAVTSWIGTRQVGTGGSSNNLQNLSYQWDLVGNLAQRQDLKQSLTEAFTNDSLNRLQSSTLNSSGNFSSVIDATGNITSRTEGGVTYPYTYDGVHKHAVATVGTGANQSTYTYDANGNMATRNGLTLSWSSANLPTTINGASGVSASFAYGPDRQRKQQTSTYVTDGANGTETTIYVDGLMEIETTPAQTHYKHLVQVPGGTKVVYDIQSVSGIQTTYLTADHLGSGNLLISSAGAVQINESFSAYGYRRSGNWSGPLAASSSDYTTIASTTRRGYTGAFHELLDNVGLIHMNGRVFDQTIGRFLSADPVLGRIGASQSGNPYSYSENRPLTLTDPTGLTASDGRHPVACTDTCAMPAGADRLPDKTLQRMFGDEASVAGSALGNLGDGAFSGMSGTDVTYASMDSSTNFWMQYTSSSGSPLGDPNPPPLAAGLATGYYHGTANPMAPGQTDVYLGAGQSKMNYVGTIKPDQGIFDSSGLFGHEGSNAELFSQINGYVGIGGSAVEGGALGRSGIGSNGSNLRFYRAFRGNQYVTVIQFMKMAKYLGYATLILGAYLDQQQVDAGTMTQGHADLNFTAGVAALLIGGIEGGGLGAVYFIGDNVVDGGWPAAARVYMTNPNPPPGVVFLPFGGPPLVTPL